MGTPRLQRSVSPSRRNELPFNVTPHTVLTARQANPVSRFSRLSTQFGSSRSSTHDIVPLARPLFTATLAASRRARTAPTRGAVRAVWPRRVVGSRSARIRTMWSAGGRLCGLVWRGQERLELTRIFQGGARAFCPPSSCVVVLLVVLALSLHHCALHLGLADQSQDSGFATSDLEAGEGFKRSRSFCIAGWSTRVSGKKELPLAGRAEAKR